MEFTMGTGGVPVGAYEAEFVGAEPYTENVEKYGPGVLLKWRILDGEEHAGDETSRICSQKMSPKSALGKFAIAIKGSPIATGDTFAFACHVGVTGIVILEETDSGGTRVSTFKRHDSPETTATAPPQLNPVDLSSSSSPTLTPEQLARAAAMLQQQQGETS